MNAAVPTTQAFDDMQLALLRGLTLNVKNLGRIDPSVEELRKKNGLSGINDGVRVLPLSDFTIDPARNPLYELTRRENYRLGDMYIDSRNADVQFRGR